MIGFSVCILALLATLIVIDIIFNWEGMDR